MPGVLEIDTFDGQAWVGLIPFTMSGIRHVALPPIPGLSSLHETNVRTYVRSGDDIGIWFFSLDASNPLVVGIARAFYSLPYHRASMRLDVGATIRYESSRKGSSQVPAEHSIEVSISGAASEATEGSLDEFLVERYRLFTMRRGQLCSADVVHPKYKIQSVKVQKVEESMLAANQIERPDLAPIGFYSPGVSVDVYGLRPCRR